MLRGPRGFAPHCTAHLHAGRRKPCVCRLFCAPTRRHKAFARRPAPYPIPPPRNTTPPASSLITVFAQWRRHSGPHLPQRPSALSANSAIAGLINLLSLDHRQHLPAIGGMTGSREREAGENGREGAKSRELSSENAEKITANAGLSPDCVAYIVRTSRPRATIAQARKNGPLSSSEGKERTGLYRNAAHDGGGFPWLIRWLHPHIEGGPTDSSCPIGASSGPMECSAAALSAHGQQTRICQPQRTTFSTACSSRSGSMSRATTVPVASISKQPGT